MLLVAGDFNCRAGLGNNSSEELILGRHSFQKGSHTEETDIDLAISRSLFIQYCEDNGLRCMNTRFPLPDIQKITYRKPNTLRNAPIRTGSYEQLDYILVNHKHQNAIHQCRGHADTWPATVSDHFPVTAAIKCRFKRAADKQTDTVVRYGAKYMDDYDPQKMCNFLKKRYKQRMQNNMRYGLKHTRTF